MDNSILLKKRQISTASHHRYFVFNKPFSLPRGGNKCESYITGQAYFEAVASAIKSAESFILLADWQLDFDVELLRDVPKGNNKREIDVEPDFEKKNETPDPTKGVNTGTKLIDLLKEKVEAGVHVRVLLYDSVDSLEDFGVPNTHEEEAQTALDKLDNSLFCEGSIETMVQSPLTGRSGELGLDLAKWSKNTWFSHHQKFVVVDGHTAFVGGFDLAWGRWDTEAHQVVIDQNLHKLNDAYNLQLTPKQIESPHRKTVIDYLVKEKKYRDNLGDGEYDPLTQPRQPWNDVAVKFMGPSAFDVFQNFVLRWNSFSKGKAGYLESALDVKWFKNLPKFKTGKNIPVDPLKFDKTQGSSYVQVCRSVSSKQLELDSEEVWNHPDRFISEDWNQPSDMRRKILASSREEAMSSHQTNIYDAMVNSIRSAQAYIYIESQFFMTECGTDSHGTTSPSKNEIGKEICDAIGRAIHANRPFHVWLVLPEHPEGMLEADGTKSQTWWAIQGVKHAKSSLKNRIEQHIKDADSKSEWTDYLTVLNLRNWGIAKSSKRKIEYVLTEMVYVHSKLTLVDDSVAVIGSANINDRSLLGNGDSELAAVVVDSVDEFATDMGAGITRPTRSFARNLRKKIWKKQLQNAYKDIPPLDSVQMIRETAKSNRATYNRVFTHTPRDDFKELLTGRKVGYKENFKGCPRLKEEFMKKGSHEHDCSKAKEALESGISGYFVEMPLDWGKGEPVTPPPPKGDEMIAEEPLPDEIVSPDPTIKPA